MGYAPLCNVDHYSHQNYAEQIPVPTVMPAGSLGADAQGGRWEEGGCSSPPLCLDGNKSNPSEVDCAVTPDAFRVGQHLVDKFFLEDGASPSAYPIYGHRSAEDRLSAVREVMEGRAVQLHLPVSHVVHRGNATASGAADGESREQYWRRISRQFIYGNGGCLDVAPAPHEPEDPFYVVDLGHVVLQMARWRHYLPMVRPFYAMKCNTNIAIMSVLAAMGAGFDCASRAEIDLVVSHNFVSTLDDIIFANPCKQRGDMRAAEALGVTYTTFDNLAEIAKIARWMPRARAVLRIGTKDASAQCALSTKFGAPLEDIEQLLSAAQALQVNVCGVSFHVGSGNADLSAYVSAIRDAHSVFRLATRYNFNCSLLDIGGGFPGPSPLRQPRPSRADSGSGGLSFEAIACAIAPLLTELFAGVTIISEPGRYFTAGSHALLLNVFAKRTLRIPDAEMLNGSLFAHAVALDDRKEYHYYVNDGVYHSFNCIFNDHARPTLLLLDDGDGTQQQVADTNTAQCTDLEGMATADPLLRRRYAKSRPLRLTTIFGPTCDSHDCILRRQPFPEMHLDDWLLVPDMGSYTAAAGCSFNGFTTRRYEYISSVVV